jgi:hypothetical protein
MVKSRLAAVDQQMKNMGYAKEVLSEGRGKDYSEKIKKAAKEKWAGLGYEYFSRPAI